MKGDMAGAAAVVGLMRALASRKAKANVIACSPRRNMPDAKAQRPGDIVKSFRARPSRSSHRRGRPARAPRRALVR